MSPTFRQQLLIVFCVCFVTVCQAYDESVGYIVGVTLGSAVGSIFFIAIIAALIYFFYLRKTCQEMRMRKQEKSLGIKAIQKQPNVVVGNEYSNGKVAVVPEFTQSRSSMILGPESPRFAAATRPVALQKAGTTEQLSNSFSSKVSSVYSSRSVLDAKAMSAVYRDSAV